MTTKELIERYFGPDISKWYDDDFCLNAVKEDAQNLWYVRNQTEEMCLEAIRQDGLSLCHIRNQTRELCLAAIRQNPDALQYVHCQTEELGLEAIKINSRILHRITKQNFEIIKIYILANTHINWNDIDLNVLTEEQLQELKLLII